jgi:hypothetical protein
MPKNCQIGISVVTTVTMILDPAVVTTSGSDLMTLCVCVYVCVCGTEV